VGFDAVGQAVVDASQVEIVGLDDAKVAFPLPRGIISVRPDPNARRVP
jgi:hypothetical protein